MTQLFLLRLVKESEESVRHKHENSKVDLKFLVEDECTKSKCFYVNKLISKVRNQLDTNVKVDYSVEASCFDRLKEVSMLH